jgi:integrase
MGGVPGSGLAIEDPQGEVARLRSELQDAHGQVRTLHGVVADQARALAGLAPPDAVNSLPLKDVFAAYEVHRGKEHSWIVIRDRLRPLVRRLGDLPCGLLTPKKWSEHRRARMKEVMYRGTGPNATTLNIELARAKTMLKWAAEEEQGFVSFNPLRDAKREKQKPPRRTWLTEADLQRLLKAEQPIPERARLMFHAFLLTAADTGLRFDEVRTLRRDRISRIDGAVVVQIPDTKNRKAHLAGLTSRAWEALSEIAHCGSEFFFGNHHRNGRLFSESSIWRWFRLAAEDVDLDSIVAAGEGRVRIHDLRRSAASNAHNRGATLLEVQDLLNHSNPGITAQYVQRTNANAIRVARLMERGAEMERRGPQRSPNHGSENKK